MDKKDLEKLIKSHLSLILDNLSGLAIFSVVAGAVQIFLLYITKASWFSYTHTYVGQKFIETNPDKADFIMTMISMNFISATIKISAAALILCVITAFIAQFTQISRWFFFSKGFLGKLLIWIIPLCAANGKIADILFHLPFYQSSILSILPIITIINKSFEFSAKILPEFSVIKEEINKLQEKKTSIHK